MTDQFSMFDEQPPFPDGFRYRPDLLGAAAERTLLEQVQQLPLEEFEFHGYTGKRRVISYGWHYDFARRALAASDPIPSFLHPVRELAAEFAELDPDQLQQVLVTEYSPGAGIGWHRDKAVFGDVIGISLLSPCIFRLRRRAGDGWERVSLTAAERSAYLLRGPSRTEWEHSIPGVAALRYSITFRNLRGA